MNSIVKVLEFTDLPGARHRDDGDGSADEFFEDYLESSLSDIFNKKQGIVTIDLDGTYGYASSFVSQLAVRIKELFKGKKRSIKKHIIIKSDDDPWQRERFWNEIER